MSKINDDEYLMFTRGVAAGLLYAFDACIEINNNKKYDNPPKVMEQVFDALVDNPLVLTATVAAISPKLYEALQSSLIPKNDEEIH